jgi:Holliday junction resolvase
MNSRQKGARGERSGAKAWAEVMGGTARRGQQFAGGTTSPDIVISQPDIHLECKRTERGNPYLWLEQAARDAGPKVPVVLHKRNNKPWILILELAHAPRFIMAAQDVGPAEGVGAEEVPHTDAGQGVPPAGEEE